jgi:hypothetical protein
MDNNFYQDDFEQFLQDEVKQHRMNPSDHIWKNIRTEVHGYTAWPALTFISLFIITALTISTLLINHPDKRVAQPAVIATVVKTAPAKAFRSVIPAVATVTTENDYLQQIAPEQITAETFAGLNELNPDQETAMTGNSIHERAVTVVRTEPAVNRQYIAEKLITKEIPVTAQPELQNTLIASAPVEKEDNILYAASETQENLQTTAPALNKTEAHGTADDFLKDFMPVVNVNPAKRNSKIGFQFYITPSTSYRKLSDQKVKEIIQPAAAAAASSQNVPLSANYTSDINNVVRHKPAMGLELGFAVLYNMSSRIKFKTGIQLNVRQYYIETYQSFTNDLASLSLINYRGIETINFYTPYNNNTGYKQTQLDNKLYQVSVPLGIQWDMIQGKHLGISTEASVQPTMTLNNNTYLMSTDYKHYTDGNDFIRKWNINTSLGLNITYKTGTATWQLGPQLRYQHLPTYSNVYPIKEYLMDYGIRLGFTRQIK